MNADKLVVLQHSTPRELKHAQTTDKVIGVFFQVYNELGHGFLECVYEQAMAIALTEAGLDIKRQIAIPVCFRGRQIGDFKADMLVDDSVLLELKAVRAIDLAFEKQLLNYLRATEIEVGLLLNFGHRPEFRRLLFENTRKNIRVHPR
ncbi:MAG TPA: GxxExxY protein [Terriglobales bacterium]|nr:GxxExxY protein [Terriglobales bacterium]